jgi:hypothetical protein
VFNQLTYGYKTKILENRNEHDDEKEPGRRRKIINFVKNKNPYPYLTTSRDPFPKLIKCQGKFIENTISTLFLAHYS